MYNNSDEVFGKNLEQLRDKAVKQCIDIYRDFTAADVKGCPPSLQKAWEIGKAFLEPQELKT